MQNADRQPLSGSAVDQGVRVRQKPDEGVLPRNSHEYVLETNTGKAVTSGRYMITLSLL
ncbi:hypothetical protein YA0002_10225 [Pseudomonas cichorii]|uniref:hypothetical protein n=1 Tax=Pseudomonas cichorii TaxID=36746 RepID=UPI0018E5B86B|nr:hypothetical protein [Pseudomonas cichorii]MBI6853141.1 hypothetical protein [Pseudomonas cichorii]